MKSEPKFTLISGGKDKPIAKKEDWQERVIKDSKIEEVRVFNEGEILGLVEQIAKKEGVAKKALELTDIIYDEDGNLIGLMVGVKPEVANLQGWGKISYDYMIKGVHRGCGFTDESMIARVYANKEDPNTWVAGGIVARFGNDKWSIDPGQIAPTARDIEIIEE